MVTLTTALHPPEKVNTRHRDTERGKEREKERQRHTQREKTEGT